MAKHCCELPSVLVRRGIQGFSAAISGITPLLQTAHCVPPHSTRRSTRERGIGNQCQSACAISPLQPPPSVRLRCLLHSCAILVHFSHGQARIFAKFFAKFGSIKIKKRKWGFWAEGHANWRPVRNFLRNFVRMLPIMRRTARQHSWFVFNNAPLLRSTRAASVPVRLPSLPQCRRAQIKPYQELGGLHVRAAAGEVRCR